MRAARGEDRRIWDQRVVSAQRWTDCDDVDAGRKERLTTLEGIKSIADEYTLRIRRITGLFREAGRDAPRAAPRLR